MTFLVRYLEIFTTFSLQAKCFHDIFSLHFHYISRQIFTTNKFSRHPFTTFSLQIFTTKGRTDRDEQTPWGHTDRSRSSIFTTFSLHFHYIFTTILSRAANLHIFTTFSRHFHYIFMTILSQAANLHIFTTFSLHFHDIFTTFL